MKFVTEEGLAREVAKLVKNAREVRIAVAFWGKGGGDALRLGGLNSAARILCNLTSGACNPAEIELLLKRHHVRSHEDLHAKVYWTPTAAVVGSSNASTNGLAVSGEKAAGWREANVLVDAPAVVAEIGDWFEAQWAHSEPITDRLLERAKFLWRRNSDRVPMKGLPKTSLLEAAKRAPEKFDEIRIYLVIYSELMSPAARRAVKTEPQKLPEAKGIEGWWAYEDCTLPPASWLIDCYLPNRGKPAVKGVAYFPESELRIPVSDRGEVRTAPIARREPAVDVGGARLLRLSGEDKRELEDRMHDLYASRRAERAGDCKLLRFSDAARILTAPGPQPIQERGPKLSAAGGDRLPDAVAAINAVSKWRGPSKNFLVAIGEPLRIRPDGTPLQRVSKSITGRRRAFVEELRELAGSQRATFERGLLARGHVIFASSGPLSEALELGTVKAVAPDPDIGTYDEPRATFRLTGRI